MTRLFRSMATIKEWRPRHKGRPIEQIGAHCKGENANSIGICYIGGMDKENKKAKDTRTDAQKKALVELVASLKEQYPDATIHGHNEFANKACPSFDVQKEFGEEEVVK